MNTAVETSDVSRVLRAVDRAQEANALCGRSLHFGEVEEAQQQRLVAGEALNTARVTLLSLGATATEVPPAKPIPLSLLSTPASRRLLDTLRAAVEAAEAVDQERGNILPDCVTPQPGETRGTAWAETLSELVLRLRIEVEGPKGRG